MGSTCSTVKKSSSSSAKEGERKQSAESIPYGQVSSSTQEAVSHEQREEKPASIALPSITATATSVSKCSPSLEVPITFSSPQGRDSSLGVASTTSAAISPPPPSPSPGAPASSTVTPTFYSSGSAGGPPANQSISPTKGHINLSQYTDTLRSASFTQLFALVSELGPPPIVPTSSSSSSSSSGSGTPTTDGSLGLEDFYLIAISTESDEVTMWSVYEQRAVRTLCHVPRPRDVRMVDAKLAVMLCNRELNLYNLDEGRLVNKLKGVMNQKMPYYGLHSHRYVVALSRNRMYVNMINLTTGDLETTFKAGEDRFLNSLLTSANGKMCVCGDETQKPFPLLVWDLTNRKLQYDLRIPSHEFITRLSAISDDGHYVVCVSKEVNSSSPNFLVVYDLQSGTLFKKWKPECDSVSVAISMRCGGCVINGTVDNKVLVWDLSTGNIKYTLTGHKAPPDLLQPAHRANVFMSYNSTCIDATLRVWSLDTGACLWIFQPEEEISCCLLMPNGLTIVYGHVGEKQLRLATRDPAKEDQETTEVDEALLARHIQEMKTRVVAYGTPSLDGHTFDLSKP